MKREQTNLPNTEFTTATGNYDESRSTIDRVVIHSTVGSVASAVSRFGTQGSQVSAHYIVGRDGKLWQGLEEYFTAYHSGNYSMNQRSIGIEHEWNFDAPPTDALYKTAGALVKDICTFYNLPIDRAHVIPHKEVVATGCPNGIDVDRIIREAGGSQPIDDCPAKLAEKTALETELRSVIQKKDAEIAELKAKDANYEALVSEKNGISVQLAEVLKSQEVYKAEYDKANAPDGYKAQIAHLEDMKKLTAEEVTKLQTRNSYLETKYANVKKPIQKLIIAMAEKLGIQL